MRAAATARGLFARCFTHLFANQRAAAPNTTRSGQKYSTPTPLLVSRGGDFQPRYRPALPPHHSRERRQRRPGGTLSQLYGTRSGSQCVARTVGAAGSRLRVTVDFRPTRRSPNFHSEWESACGATSLLQSAP